MERPKSLERKLSDASVGQGILSGQHPLHTFDYAP